MDNKLLSKLRNIRMMLESLNRKLDEYMVSRPKRVRVRSVVPRVITRNREII